MNFKNLEKKLGVISSAPNSFTGAFSRRQFIKLSTFSGLAIGLSACAPDQAETADDQILPDNKDEAALTPTQIPNDFLQIAPHGKITIQVNRLEFGQGSHTGLARILADELDADWSTITAELSDAGETFKDPRAGMQFTGGSSSIKHSFQQYRELGARARVMLMNAAADLWDVTINDVSTESGYVTGTGGQRASYGELATAAMQQSIPKSVKLKEASEFKMIGKGAERLDTVAKSSGRQTFGIDVNLPESRVVLIARPPTFGGNVISFDASEARTVPGIDDILKVNLDLNASGIAVIADGYWPAKLARDKLKIKWSNGSDPLPDSEQIKADFTQLLDEPGLAVQDADISGLSNAAKTIKADFEFPFLAHTPMEPLNATVEMVGEGDAVGVVIYSGTQFQTFDQLKVAEVMGLKPEQVAIRTQFAGGGFGRRATGNSDCLADAARCMNAWLATGRKEPLKLMWSREDDVRGGYYRPFTMHRAEIGLSGSGEIVAWRHRVVQPALSAGTPLEALFMKDGLDGSAAEGIQGSPYTLPIKVDVHHPKSQVPVLWWRSVGHTHTAFVMETLIDQIAVETEQDPVALRRKLLADKPRELLTLDLAIEQSGYGSTLPDGHAWGLAIHKSFDSVIAHVVDVSIEDSKPRVHKVTSAVHCNLAVNPTSVEAQIQGSILMGLGTILPGAEITVKDGKVQQSNFHDYIVARMPNMPEVDVHIVPSNEPPTGVGEPGLPPIAPAIANALYALTGKPIRSLPIKENLTYRVEDPVA